MTIRLVLLHGWGANGDDLRPLGEQLAQRTSAPLETICLEAPERHPGQPGGRQWYGLFPSDWDAVPEAVNRLRSALLTLEGGEAALRRTVLFGFSQGGAMALDCGCSLPLAGIISCSGYAHPAWEPPADHPPVLLLHGTEDCVVPFQAMAEIQNRLDSERCETVPFQNGHTIPVETMQPILNFLKRGGEKR